MNFWDLSLTYSLSKTFSLTQPALFKSLVWLDSLFKSFVHIKSLIFLHGKGGEELVGFHHEKKIYAWKREGKKKMK